MKFYELFVFIDDREMKKQVKIGGFTTVEKRRCPVASGQFNRFVL